MTEPSQTAEYVRLVCEGKTGLGDCELPAKYRAGEYSACGVHLAQVIKAQLRFNPTARIVVAYMPDTP